MMKRAGIRTSGCDDMNWLLMKSVSLSFSISKDHFMLRLLSYRHLATAKGDVTFT
jgi:hypothetical protein